MAKYGAERCRKLRAKSLDRDLGSRVRTRFARAPCAAGEAFFLAGGLCEPASPRYILSDGGKCSIIGVISADRARSGNLN